MPIPSEGDYCLSFAYHMNGEDIGALEVLHEKFGVENELLWWIVGDQGDEWHQVRIDKHMDKEGWVSLVILSLTNGYLMALALFSLLFTNLFPIFCLHIQLKIYLRYCSPLTCLQDTYLNNVTSCNLVSRPMTSS